MRRASLAAVNEPKVIKTDKLRSYEQAIDEVFLFAKHVKSEGLRAEGRRQCGTRSSCPIPSGQMWCAAA